MKTNTPATYFHLQIFVFGIWLIGNNNNCLCVISLVVLLANLRQSIYGSPAFHTCALHLMKIFGQVHISSILKKYIYILVTDAFYY